MTISFNFFQILNIFLKIVVKLTFEELLETILSVLKLYRRFNNCNKQLSKLG